VSQWCPTECGGSDGLGLEESRIRTRGAGRAFTIESLRGGLNHLDVEHPRKGSRAFPVEPPFILGCESSDGCCAGRRRNRMGVGERRTPYLMNRVAKLADTAKTGREVALLGPREFHQLPARFPAG